MSAFGMAHYPGTPVPRAPILPRSAMRAQPAARAVNPASVEWLEITNAAAAVEIEALRGELAELRATLHHVAWQRDQAWDIARDMFVRLAVELDDPSHWMDVPRGNEIAPDTSSPSPSWLRRAAALLWRPFGG